MQRPDDMDAGYGAVAVAVAADPTTWDIWPASERHPEALYQRFPEFTCLCPRSDYPDFAVVHLVTVPQHKVVELKHLKLWFNSFRDRRISHELATAEIVDTLATTLDPHYLFVLMDYTPRGNLTTVPMVEYQRPRTGELAADNAVRLALENARHVKRRLIDRVVG